MHLNRKAKIFCAILVSFPTLILFQNFSPVSIPVPLTKKLSAFIGGLSTAASFRDSFPFFREPQKIVNNSNVQFAGSELRFTDFYKNFFMFGLQKNQSYFYLWQPANTLNLICEGHLQTSRGEVFNSNDLSFVVVGDFLPNDRMQIFGIATETNTYYLWDLGVRKTLGTSQPCQGQYHFPAVAEGSLTNYNGVGIRGLDLKHVVATDWDNDGVQEIMGFQNKNAWSMVWRNEDGRGIQHWRDFPLGGLNVKEISTIVATQRSQGSPHSGSEKNIPLETELYLHSPKGMTRLQANGQLTDLPNCKIAPNLCQDLNVILSIDQLFKNGLMNVARESSLGPEYGAAVDRVINQLATLRSLFAEKGIEFTVLVNPSFQNRNHMRRVLDKLNALNVPFILEILSSDSRTAATQKRFPNIRVPDPIFGRTLDLSPLNVEDPVNIDFYTARYPKNLKGFRIFEQLGLRELHLTCRFWLTTEPESERFKQTCFDYVGNPRSQAQFFPTLKMDQDTARWAADVQFILDYASKRNLAVLWSDNHEFDPYEFYQVGWYQDQLKSLLEAERLSYLQFKTKMSQKFPKTVVAIYANNEGTKLVNLPGQTSPKEISRNFRLGTWTQAPRNVLSAKGWGLSNQSWISDHHIFWNDELIPPSEMATWTLSALNGGAKWIQFEPFWAFFNWPRPDGKNSIRIEQIQQPCLGTVNSNLLAQLDLFGVRSKGLLICR